MLLTIHNLPSTMSYGDVKKLVKDTCHISEFILDNLTGEGRAKKVTIGLATASDGEAVLRKINGIYIGDMQIYVEDRSKTKNLNNHSSTTDIQERPHPSSRINDFGPIGTDPMMMNSDSYGTSFPVVEQDMPYMDNRDDPQTMRPTSPKIFYERHGFREQANVRGTRSQKQRFNMFQEENNRDSSSERSSVLGNSYRERSPIRWPSQEPEQNSRPFLPERFISDAIARHEYDPQRWESQESWRESNRSGSNSFESSFSSNTGEPSFRQLTVSVTNDIRQAVADLNARDQRSNIGSSQDGWVNDRFHYVAPNRLGTSEPTPAGFITRKGEMTHNFLKRNHSDILVPAGNQTENNGPLPKRAREVPNVFNQQKAIFANPGAMQGTSNQPFNRGDELRSENLSSHTFIPSKSKKKKKQKMPREDRRQAKIELAAAVLNKRATSKNTITAADIQNGMPGNNSKILKSNRLAKCINRDETIRATTAHLLTVQVKNCLPKVADKPMSQSVYDELKKVIRLRIDEICGEEFYRDTTSVMQMYKESYPLKTNRKLYEEIQNRCIAKAVKTEIVESKKEPEEFCQPPPPSADKPVIKDLDSKLYQTMNPQCTVHNALSKHNQNLGGIPNIDNAQHNLFSSMYSQSQFTNTNKITSAQNRLFQSLVKPVLYTSKHPQNFVTLPPTRQTVGMTKNQRKNARKRAKKAAIAAENAYNPANLNRQSLEAKDKRERSLDNVTKSHQKSLQSLRAASFIAAAPSELNFSVGTTSSPKIIDQSSETQGPRARTREPLETAKGVGQSMTLGKDKNITKSQKRNEEMQALKSELAAPGNSSVESNSETGPISVKKDTSDVLVRTEKAERTKKEPLVLKVISPYSMSSTPQLDSHENISGVAEQRKTISALEKELSRENNKTNYVMKSASKTDLSDDIQPQKQKYISDDASLKRIISPSLNKSATLSESSDSIETAAKREGTPEVQLPKEVLLVDTALLAMRKSPQPFKMAPPSLYSAAVSASNVMETTTKREKVSNIQNTRDLSIDALATMRRSPQPLRMAPPSLMTTALNTTNVAIETVNRSEGVNTGNLSLNDSFGDLSKSPPEFKTSFVTIAALTAENDFSETFARNKGITFGRTQSRDFSQESGKTVPSLQKRFSDITKKPKKRDFKEALGSGEPSQKLDLTKRLNTYDEISGPATKRVKRNTHSGVKSKEQRHLSVAFCREDGGLVDDGLSLLIRNRITDLIVQAAKQGVDHKYLQFTRSGRVPEGFYRVIPLTIDSREWLVNCEIGALGGYKIVAKKLRPTQVHIRVPGHRNSLPDDPLWLLRFQNRDKEEELLMAEWSITCVEVLPSDEIKQRVLEFSKKDLFSLDPVTEKVFNEELRALANVFAGDCLDPEDSMEEAVCWRIAQRSLKEFKQVVRVHTSKRLLNIRTGLYVRIFSNGRLPRKTVMKEYLRVKGFAIDRMVVKQKPNAHMFIVSMRTFDDYDRLVRLGKDRIEETEVQFASMNLLIPSTKITTHQVRQRRRMYSQKPMQPSKRSLPPARTNTRHAFRLQSDVTNYTDDVQIVDVKDSSKIPDVVDLTAEDFTQDVMVNTADVKVKCEAALDCVKDDFTKDIKVKSSSVRDLPERAIVKSTDVKNFTDRVIVKTELDFTADDFTKDVEFNSFGAVSSKSEDMKVVKVENVKNDPVNIDNINIEDVDDDDLEDF